MSSFLGDEGKYDDLGVLNGFRSLCEKYIPMVVEEGRWFTCCHKISDKQVDIMQIKNEETGDTLGRFISNVFENGGYRSSVYKYLLMNFLCYVEVPTMSYRTDVGKMLSTFDKMLVTANTRVISDWLGLDEVDLPSKYKSRLYSLEFDDGDDNVPYVKLSSSKEGVKKASCPKKDIDLSIKGTRVIPLFMLKVGVDTLYSKLMNDVVGVTFLKDNSQERLMCTTLNESKVEEIYGDCEFTNSCLGRMYDGNFLGNSSLARGYIRVPEIGGSKYESSLRSINYARIIEINYEEKPDLSFINIDMSTVIPAFEEDVQKHPTQAKNIIDMLEAFDIDYGSWKDTPEKKAKYGSKDMFSLLDWAEEKNMLFSTVFQRQICLFMLSNPEWFGDFTGEPTETGFGSGNVGFA